MNRRIRLIWDFYGPRAEGTAKHHAIHLEEFMTREKINYFTHGTSSEAEEHMLAYITVEEKDVIIIRDTLKPNRAFVEKSESI